MLDGYGIVAALTKTLNSYKIVVFPRMKDVVFIGVVAKVSAVVFKAVVKNHFAVVGGVDVIVEDKGGSFGKPNSVLRVGETPFCISGCVNYTNSRELCKVHCTM